MYWYVNDYFVTQNKKKNYNSYITFQHSFIKFYKLILTNAKIFTRRKKQNTDPLFIYTSNTDTQKQTWGGGLVLIKKLIIQTRICEIKIFRNACGTCSTQPGKF